MFQLMKKKYFNQNLYTDVIAFNIDENSDLCEKARKLGREFVIQVNGEVIERSSKNMNISTGEIEIKVTDLTILNASKTPPFTIEDETDGGEELRMKYRYLDIRRTPIKENIILRSRVASETRKYLDAQRFYEVETPVLMKSTPEGARDFLVPSRLHNGKFYALPQSPQTYKQLLMVSGFDKYFQIVKCFRDEDFRADRQPEFTQIDIEMSFADQEDVINLGTTLTKYLWKKVLDVDLPDSFPCLTYKESMENFGSDKPDLRFDMKLKELKDYIELSDFDTFKTIVKSGPGLMTANK